MTGVLVSGYLVGWAVTSILAFVLAWRLQDAASPAAHPVLLSVVAGAAWPVLIVAIAQAGAVALTTEILHEDDTLAEPVLSMAA